MTKTYLKTIAQQKIEDYKHEKRLADALLSDLHAWLQFMLTEGKITEETHKAFFITLSMMVKKYEDLCTEIMGEIK